MPTATKLRRVDTFSEELSPIRSEEPSITWLQGVGGKQDLESDICPHNACNKTAIRFFAVKCKIWKVNPKGYFILQNFENCTQTVIGLFYNKIWNFESCTQTAIRIPLKQIQNLTIYHKFNFIS